MDETGDKECLIRRLYSFSEQIDIQDVYKRKGVKMRKVLASLTLLIVVLAACAPQAQPTTMPVDIGGGIGGTAVPDELIPAQKAAIEALSKNLGLAADEIKVVAIEAVEWPDACLGITQEGVSCAEVITPGSKITLEANGKQVEYHANEEGTVVLPATVVLTWTRSGGIAGFCDSLTVYLSGEVQGNNCKNSEMVEKSASELLSAQEFATMNDWISKYGEINIDASDPEGAADAMSVKLNMYGAGTQQNMVQASQQLLLTFAQNLYQELMSQ